MTKKCHNHKTKIADAKDTRTGKYLCDDCANELFIERVLEIHSEGDFEIKRMIEGDK